VVRITNPNYTNTNGQPQYLIRQPVGVSNTTPVASSRIPAAAWRTGYAVSISGKRRSEPVSIWRAQLPGTGRRHRPSLTQGGDWRVNDQGRNIGLDADDDRRGAFGRLSYEVANGVTLFAEASYNWQKTLFNAGPQSTTGITLTAANPYLQAALANAVSAGLITPAERSAVTSVTVGSTVDLPYRKNNSSRDVQRYAIGGEGEFQAFGHTAFWNIYGQYGETNAHEQLRDIMNTANMAAATDAVAAPAGNALGVAAGTIVCRSSLTAPTNGCVPLNRLASASRSGRDRLCPGRSVSRPETETDRRRCQSVDDPFATWAGDVSVAVGGEYRRSRYPASCPANIRLAGPWAISRPPSAAITSRKPISKRVVPLGLGLEFNGAVRGTDYSTSGYVTTWKLGATWQPIPDIRFRATRSRDIRAPNLSELYASGTSRTNTLTDPATGRTTVTFREITTGNPICAPKRPI
jgi:outer membrane receptor protein involved in Fe transport